MKDKMTAEGLKPRYEILDGLRGVAAVFVRRGLSSGGASSGSIRWCS